MPVGHSIHREAGTVTIDRSTCKKCGECTRICPTEVLRFEEQRVEVHQRLGIPRGNKPAIALIIGYPAVHFRRGVTRRFVAVSNFA